MRHMFKTTTALALIGFLAVSCGQQSGSYSDESYGEDAAVEEMEAAPIEVTTPPVARSAPTQDAAQGPGITPTAAPGVAFNYRYAFRLQNNQIAGVQEQHAAACEELGISRCRITGMRYRLVNNGDVQAMLAFKLDPAIAREFGRDAGAVVAENDGMLVDAEISGTDEGANIARAERERARLAEDIQRIEQRLRASGLSEGERVQLTQQLERLQQSTRANEDRVDASEESLATTPMVFQYGSGETIPGFDSTTPMRDAFYQSSGFFFNTIAFFIIALGVILPWLGLGLLGWLAWKAIHPAWQRRFGGEGTVSAGE